MMENKIIFKVPEFPHLSETFIVAQIVTAIKQGYDVQILTRKRIDANVSFCSSLIGEYRLLDKVIIEDFKIPSNKIFRVLKWFQILMSNLKDLHYIVKYHNEQSKFSLTWLFLWCFYKQFNNAAIIHVQYGTNSKPLDILKKTSFFKPRIIVTFHGHDAFFPIYGYIPNNGYYDSLFENDILITANTPYLANKILNLGCPNDKMQIIPVGVDTSFFYPKNREHNITKSLRLISVGRLDKIKGHHYCIEAVSELIKKGIDVTLTIIGEGEQLHNLEKLIINYKLEKHVFLLSKKSPLDIRNALWEHDIYLLLAIPVEDGRRETQGLATLEAQACGLSAIVFDSGGVKYTVDNGISGFVCKEFDVTEVVQKIELFNQNRNLLKEMGEQATIFVDNQYSQNLIDNKWKIIYEKMIKNE